MERLKEIPVLMNEEWVLSAVLDDYSIGLCGANGVDVNGKRHGADKIGCVRGFSGGRTEKY